MLSSRHHHHPLKIPESTGQVCLPESVYIDAIVISDITAHKNDASKSAALEKKRRFDQDRIETISPFIKTLRVRIVKKKDLIRAVVVIKYRNLEKFVTDNDFISGNIILIIVRPISFNAACS